MIINCENCGSKFNLDENLLNENGSKVRCSVCKKIFLVMPPEPEDEEGPDQPPEETIDLDFPSDSEPADEMGMDDDMPDEGFEKALEDTLYEGIREEEEEPEDEETTEPETYPEDLKKKKRPGLPLIIIIIVFVLILGALSVYLFAPDLLPGGLSPMQSPSEEELADSGNKRLEFERIEYSTVPTDKLGQLFIIKGKVINKYPESRSNILLKATIEDEKGNPIDRKLAYAGNIFTEHELKDISIKEIEKRLKS